MPDPSTKKATQVPDMDDDRVVRIKQQIADGTYETPAKVAGAVSALMHCDADTFTEFFITDSTGRVIDRFTFRTPESLN